MIVQPMRKLLPVSLALAFIALSAAADDAPLVRTYVYLSPTYTIDKKYRSMEGAGRAGKHRVDLHRRAAGPAGASLDRRREDGDGRRRRPDAAASGIHVPRQRRSRRGEAQRDVQPEALHAAAPRHPFTGDGERAVPGRLR